MPTFEIYPTDLNPEARVRYAQAIGGEEQIQDDIPIAVLELDEEVGPLIVDIPLLDEVTDGGEE